MNVQELETAVRLCTPVVALVWRDDGYGVIRWNQLVRFGRTASVDFGNPDLVALAQSFGAVGLKVSAPTDLRSCLAEAFRSERPVVIDCPVDYAENLRLTERLKSLD
jgi:acetolactate synthase I/II/III large subunit